MNNDIKLIEKPWGYEKLIEVNDNYVVKELFMKKGFCCSLQYHEKKHETFYVVDGEIKFEVGTEKDKLEEIILKKGDFYSIPPFLIHRMSAISDSLYIESSTNYLTDVIRLEDNYGRI